MPTHAEMRKARAATVRGSYSMPDIAAAAKTRATASVAAAIDRESAKAQAFPDQIP